MKPNRVFRMRAIFFLVKVLGLGAYFTPVQVPLLPPFPIASMLASADGSTIAMVGISASSTPSVALYQRAPSEWALQQVLQGIVGPALSGDGQTLISMPIPPATAPIIYARAGLVWTQLQLLSTPWDARMSPAALAFVNTSTLAVLLRSPTQTLPPAIQLFSVAPNGTWMPAAAFPVASTPYSGYSDLAAGEATVATSAYVPKYVSGSQLSVALATRDRDGVWSSPGTFVTARDGGSGDAFGAPLLSADGRTLLAVSKGTTCVRPSVSIFRRGFVDWALEAVVEPVDGYTSDPFTTSVAFTGDGNLFATGGTANATVSACGGGAYATTRVSVYRYNGARGWALNQRVIADVPAGTPTPCVATVALSGDSTALFIATTFTNGSAAPVIVYEAQAPDTSAAGVTAPASGAGASSGSTSVVGIPPPAPLMVYDAWQQVYTPCCCTLAVSDDGSTLVSGTTTGPGAPPPTTCVSTFLRSGMLWVLAEVLYGFVSPAISDDSTQLAALNVTAGGPPTGVTIFSEPQRWSVQTQLVLPPGTILGVDFLSSATLAVAVWSSVATAPCVNGKIIVQIFTRVQNTAQWLPGDQLIPSVCFMNPTSYSSYSPVVRASARSVVVGTAQTSSGASGPEGVLVSWTLGDGGVWTERDITGGNGGTGDGFGASGAFSSDGSIIAVGAPANMPAPRKCPPRAAAYLFSSGATSSNQSWAQVTALVPPDGFNGDLAGAAVALSFDGSTALVSSNPGPGSRDCGAQAYVFQRMGASGWTMTQRLFPDAASAPCITSVALALDGAYAFVGTFNASAQPKGLTPIFVFASFPAPPPPPPPPPPPSPIFPAFALTQSMYAPCCCDLVMAGDGLTLVSSGTTPQCSAIYTRPAAVRTSRSSSAANWTLQQVLPGVMYAVLSNNGSLLVGVLNPAVPPVVPPTTVVVYARSGTVYRPVQQLPPIASGAVIVGLGYLSGAEFAVATWSGPSPPPAPCAAGTLSVGLAQVTADTWTPGIILTPTDCAIPLPTSLLTGAAPWPVATAVGVVAVSMAMPSGSTQGVNYIFARGADSAWSQTTVTAVDGGSGDTFGTSVALSPDAFPSLIAGAPGGSQDRGAAYVYSPFNSGLWAAEQRVLASDNMVGDSFGAAVAVSFGGKTLIVSSASTAVVNCSAEAYVFAYDSGPAVWVEQQIVITSQAVVCVSDVAVTPDGATVFVAALKTNAPDSDGRIYVYDAQSISH